MTWSQRQQEVRNFETVCCMPNNMVADKLHTVYTLWYDNYITETIMVADVRQNS